MKRSIGFIISIVIVLAIAGIVIFNFKKKPVPPQNNQQYGILKPQPGETSNIRDFNSGQNQSGQQAPTPSTAQPSTVATTPTPTPTPAPKPKVLGANTSASTPKTTPAPKPATISENTTATYNISALSFIVTVPQGLHPVSTTKVGNVIQFFDASNKEYGEVEVLPNAYETLSGLSQALQSDPNISGIIPGTAAGQDALIFNDARYGRSIAFVYKNNVYYLRGAFAGSALSNFKLE